MKQGRPVWELSAAAAPQTETLNADIRSDVLIIGAGYSGLSTALHLSGSGLDVTVIESSSIGDGASGRNGGHVVPLIKRPPDSVIAALGSEHGERLLRLVAGSADTVFALINEHNIQCDAERKGWLQPAHSPRHLQTTEKLCEQWRDWNTGMSMLDQNGLARCMGTDVYSGGLLVKGGGHVNPLAYLRGMARAVLAQGNSVYTSTPAVSMEQQGSHWLVKTPGGSILAEKVVLATAAYSGKLWPELASSFIPFYLYSIATTPLPDSLRESIMPGRQPATDTRSDAHVFHYDGAGRLITGATFVFPAAWQARIARKARDVLCSTFPQIGTPQFETGHVWRGRVAMTKDMLPHLHLLAPNVFSWLGCNGRGIALASSMGAVLADAVKGVAQQDWSIQPVKLEGIPAHTLARLLTSMMLVYYRYRDRFIK